MLGVVFDYLPKSCLIALGALVVAVPAALNAYRNADDTKKLIPALGMNVLTNIITPVLVAVGLFVG